MPGAGDLTTIVVFKRLDTTGDVYGNPSTGAFAAFLTVHGKFRETLGRERIEAGALAAPMTGTLEVRATTASRAVTEADMAEIDGVEWNIRSIATPGRRGRWIQMTIERGVAN